MGIGSEVEVMVDLVWNLNLLTCVLKEKEKEV